VRVRGIFVLAVLGMASAVAGAGVFSRTATTVQLLCVGVKCAPVVDVFSPDGEEEIRRTFAPLRDDRLNITVDIPKLTVVTQTGRWELAPDESRDPWLDLDVLWSPDSRFVALTGHTNTYIEYLRVFAITGSGPREVDASLQPGQDMVHRFGPYCDRYVGKLRCNLNAEDPNFAAITWTDHNTLVLMSEVPCSTIWGGIMCQLMGYEVDIPSGKILRAMTPREFRARWQHSMAWKFRIPQEPPDSKQ
jgi:hypothetical protein